MRLWTRFYGIAIQGHTHDFFQRGWFKTGGLRHFSFLPQTEKVLSIFLIRGMGVIAHDRANKQASPPPPQKKRKKRKKKKKERQAAIITLQCTHIHFSQSQSREGGGGVCLCTYWCSCRAHYAPIGVLVEHIQIYSLCSHGMEKLIIFPSYDFGEGGLLMPSSTQRSSFSLLFITSPRSKETIIDKISGIWMQLHYVLTLYPL